MANESRVFRLPAGMSTQVVANAVEAFLSSAKGMEVQSAETTEGYVVQGRQEKDGWKTIAGMRMAKMTAHRTMTIIAFGSIGSFSPHFCTAMTTVRALSHS